ncbi:MAG: flavoprotein [Pirellulaceae bacterium]
MSRDVATSDNANRDSARILIGVSGGIAAYKIATLVSGLVKHGHDVTVIMSQAATRFVGPDTFRALSGNDVYTSIFEPSMPLGAHVSVTKETDLFLVAPATADTIAAMAHGSANNLLNAAFLAFDGPVLCAPAMNTRMWNKPAVQRNIAQLIDDGIQMVGPETGWLSCREQGVGRMAEPDTLMEAIISTLSTTDNDV